MKTLVLLVVTFFSLNLLADTNVTLGLNWKAESEFGGFYTAQIRDFYKKRGIKAEILEGGAGTPTIQMLSAGSIDFGVVSGDELVTARAQGQKLVAIYAVFQQSPYMLMARTSKDYKTLEDLFKSNSTIAMAQGLPFVSFLEKKYGFKTVKVVPYGGGIANYLSDENFAQQGFISSEPLLAEKKGVKSITFLISDAGFNPYVVVVAVQEKTLKEKPELVKSMVAAMREGWTEYLANPKATQELIAKMNPTMDVKTQQNMAKVEKPLIEMDKKSKAPLGSMTEARWSTLVDQMFDLKLIKTKPKASEIFTNF